MSRPVSKPAAVRRVGLTAALLGATVALFFVSRGKWSDAIIDSGREWIVPDALARGELLYRDVVYWFGPFTPYFQAASFRVFGSNFVGLLAAGALGTVGVLWALHAGLRRVTGRAEARIWTALAIPVLVFMPYSGGSLIGMGFRMWHAAGFALAAAALASGRRPRALPRSRWIAAGVAAALAGLCRSEWGLAALAAVLLARVVRERGGPGPARAVGRDVALATGAALIVWTGVVGVLVLLAGRESVLGDTPLLFRGVTTETRHFLFHFSGLGEWRRGAAILLGSTALWGCVYLAVERACIPGGAPGVVRARRRAFLAALAVLAVFLTSPRGDWAGVVFSIAPLLCVVSLLLGVFRLHGPRASAFAAFGFLGAVLSFRRVFDIRDLGYVAPVLLMAFVCAAGLLRLAVLGAGTGPRRHRLRTGLRVAVSIAVVVGFLWRTRHYTMDTRVAIRGSSRMLSASPELAAEIEGLAAVVRGESHASEGLVVIPEGEALNFLTGQPNPIRDKLLIPGYLTGKNEDRILRELRVAQPRWIVVWQGPEALYGKRGFGIDYGMRVAEWIGERYRERDFPGRASNVDRRRTVLFEREDPPR